MYSNLLNSKIPEGIISEKWKNRKSELDIISPNNRSKIELIVVGSGLAGGSASATLAELGYNVKVFCYQDSPRRAHSVAAQGGINASKNYKGDNDSIYRLFYDTIRGGDYRSREANVYRLAEVSSNIIDQCVSQGVPFAREYSGLLDNRSFGGVKVSRTFYAKGQTGQQLLLGCYSAMCRQISKGKIKLYNRHEMLDIILIDGKARGIISRNLINGEIKSYFGHAIIIASGGYGNVFFLSTNAMGSNTSSIWKIYKKGAFFANPCFTQIHPTCIPVYGKNQSKLTLMSESLRNDGRIWVPKSLSKAASIRKGSLLPESITESEKDFFLEKRYPSFGNLVPRDIASRAIKEKCDIGYGIKDNNNKEGVFLDFSYSIKKYGKEKSIELGLKNPNIEEIISLGEKVLENKYGNLFQMYNKITNKNPYKTPMEIYPAIHYTMGGIWVDYNLMSTIPGCYVIGEANFSDHGSNRLGASALMQGLADGYFILPYTIADYLSKEINENLNYNNYPDIKKNEKTIKNKLEFLTKKKGNKTVDYFHRLLGNIMWKKVGISRNEKSLKEAISDIKNIRYSFWKNICIPGNVNEFNPELEKAGRLADFLELGELIAMDALNRKESCGGHFREEFCTIDGETLRDDNNFSYVSAWEFSKEVSTSIIHKENLDFKFVKPEIRSYK